jgi:hypothetical protein
MSGFTWLRALWDGDIEDVYNTQRLHLGLAYRPSVEL